MSARAQQVMPFDLSRSTNPQTPATATSSALTCGQKPRTSATGNYSDPAKIHGMDMPGVNELETRSGSRQGDHSAPGMGG